MYLYPVNNIHAIKSKLSPHVFTSLFKDEFTVTYPILLVNAILPNCCKQIDMAVGNGMILMYNIYV